MSYWAKPIPGYGDPKATLLIVGLAPQHMAATRTGEYSQEIEKLWRVGWQTLFGNRVRKSIVSQKMMDMP